MTYLLDINVLLALCITTHPQHLAAKNRLKHVRDVATCPLVELGAIRVGMQAYSARFREMQKVLFENMGRFNHSFWSDDLTVAELREDPARPLTALTLNDRYLVALVNRRNKIQNNFRLLTFDRGIKQPGVEVIPANS